MKNRGIIDELEKSNVKWVFTCGVDNVLVNMVDPYLLGLAIQKKCKLATRSLVKNSPTEKIGVICKQKNKVKAFPFGEIQAHTPRFLRGKHTPRDR